MSAVELFFCPGPPQQLVSSARDKKPRGRYARLEEEMERGNQDFIEQQRHQQQVRLKHARIWISCMVDVGLCAMLAPLRLCLPNVCRWFSYVQSRASTSEFTHLDRGSLWLG